MKNLNDINFVCYHICVVVNPAITLLVFVCFTNTCELMFTTNTLWQTYISINAHTVRLFMLVSFVTYLLFLFQTERLRPNRDTVFFRDGVRRIDFVLSYVDDKDERKQVGFRKLLHWLDYLNYLQICLTVMQSTWFHNLNPEFVCSKGEVGFWSFSGVFMKAHDERYEVMFLNIKTIRWFLVSLPF